MNRRSTLANKVPDGCVPLSEIALYNKSEHELAAKLRQRGKWVVVRRGRAWVHIGAGIWEPVHWLARLRPEEMVRPHFICLAYVATVADAARDRVDGAMPMHLLEGDRLMAYDVPSLPSKRRNQLRKAWRENVFMAIIEPEAHLRRLHEVACSAIARFRGYRLPSFDRFSQGLLRRVKEDRDLLLASFFQGQLAGYFLVSAVDGVVYIDQVMLDTQYLSSNAGTGLTYELVMLAKRTRGVRAIVYGLHSLEKPSLTKFKEEMGFRVERVPAVWRSVPGLATVLGYWSPEKIYRLTGVLPPSHGRVRRRATEK